MFGMLAVFVAFKGGSLQIMLSDAANGLSENASFAPSGLGHFLKIPRLAPWAALFRRFAAF
jgi:hypothetical protein